MNNTTIGVITEQGDLGLGFEQLTETEVTKLNNNKDEDNKNEENL